MFCGYGMERRTHQLVGERNGHSIMFGGVNLLCVLHDGGSVHFRNGAAGGILGRQDTKVLRGGRMKPRIYYAIVERYKKRRMVRGYNYDRRDKGVCTFGGVPCLFANAAYAEIYCKFHRISLIQYKIISVEIKEIEVSE